MTLKKFCCTCLIGLVLLSGCRSASIKPFEGETHIAAQTEGEERLWASAEKLDAMIKKAVRSIKTNR